MPKKLNKTTIKQTLQESAFDPKEDKFLKIISDMDDPCYAERRAIELIHEMQICVDTLNWEHYKTKSKQAISLLAMARIQRS